MKCMRQTLSFSIALLTFLRNRFVSSSVKSLASLLPSVSDFHQQRERYRQSFCSWCQGAAGASSTLGLYSRSRHCCLHGDRDGPRPGQDVSPGCHVQGQAGQGWDGLVSSPAEVSLQQGLMAQGR